MLITQCNRSIVGGVTPLPCLEEGCLEGNISSWLLGVQINDRYEFPEELDLDRDNRRYMSRTADPKVRNLYRLHSVLVHSGGVHGGHYYAFIRPTGSTYLKFDDEKVCPSRISTHVKFD